MCYKMGEEAEAGNWFSFWYDLLVRLAGTTCWHDKEGPYKGPSKLYSKPQLPIWQLRLPSGISTLRRVFGA